MTVQIDNRFTRFIQCECRDGRIIFQLDHATGSFWQLCGNRLCVLIHRRCWIAALFRKRSDWEQSNDHRYSEDNAEDSFAFSF